jgi:hypothetical protein
MGWLTMEELVWHPQTGLLTTHAPSTYKIPTANDCPPVFNVRLFAADNPADTIHRSKAAGEPPLLLPFSVFYAIRDAVSAAGGHRVDPPLAAPATAESILRAIVQCGPPVVEATSGRRHALAAGRRAIVVGCSRHAGQRAAGANARRRSASSAIGGGHLELKALLTARSMLDADDVAPRSEHFFAPGSARRSGDAGYEPAARARFLAGTRSLFPQLYGPAMSDARSRRCSPRSTWRSTGSTSARKHFPRQRHSARRGRHTSARSVSMQSKPKSAARHRARSTSC